jgi:hypothetical protein
MNKLKIPGVLVGAALLASLAGCSHTHAFNANPEVGALTQHKLKGKTLALDMANVPEEFSDRASGHKFKITGIRTHTNSMVRKLFANERIVDDPAKAEYVLKLKLMLTLKSALMGTKCVAQSQWDILRKGKLVSTGTGEESTSIPTVYAAGGNCEVSSIKAISTGLDAAMAKL